MLRYLEGKRHDTSVFNVGLHNNAYRHDGVSIHLWPVFSRTAIPANSSLGFHEKNLNLCYICSGQRVWISVTNTFPEAKELGLHLLFVHRGHWLNFFKWISILDWPLERKEVTKYISQVTAMLASWPSEAEASCSSNKNRRLLLCFWNHFYRANFQHRWYAPK